MGTTPVSGRVTALRKARDKMNAVREEIYAAVEGRSDEELLAPPAGASIDL